jgi:hypothetical protein
MTDNQDDGFDDFNLEQIGLQTGAFGGARLLKFDTDKYVTREGDVIGPEHHLLSMGLVKVVQKFVQGKLAKTIIVPPGEKMPDVERMNEEAPREEWGPDPFNPGNMVGPYSGVLVLKFIEEPALNRYAFITKSLGGCIAVGDLSDKIKIMRRLHGPDVTAIVSPQTTLWKTRFSVRKRPHFQVVGWRKLGSDGNGEPLPPPKTPLTLGTTVAPPTLKEEMQDEVPF